MEKNESEKGPMGWLVVAVSNHTWEAVSCGKYEFPDYKNVSGWFTDQREAEKHARQLSGE